MARYHGRVGFLIHFDNQETGIADEEAVEKPFYGKVLEYSRRLQTSDTVTDDLQMGNQISITASDYAFQHASCIAYCEYMGSMWKVTGIKVKRPQIILTLGGVYNGKRPIAAPGTVARSRAESLVQTPSQQ